MARVRERIAAAAERAGRDPQDVRLVAVTKTVASERVREAVAAGVTDVGESRVQEAEAKRPSLPAGVRLHMIGHVQGNKAARAAALFDVVHSVDGERLARALAARRDPAVGPLEVLVEVELTGLPGRTGCAADEVEALVRTVTGLPRLMLSGLMTVAAPDPAAARSTFARLRELRDRVGERTGVALPHLSMGMSDDFETAVEEGATVVRVGRAIFGERGLG